MIASVMIVYEIVNRRGEPYEEEIVGTFVHRERAERELAKERILQGDQKMLDGRPCIYIRENLINAEER